MRHTLSGIPGWGGILSNQTLRETSEGDEVTILPTPLFSGVLCHSPFWFIPAGNCQKSEEGLERQLSSPKLVIFSFCWCSVLFSRERLKNKKPSQTKTSQITLLKPLSSSRQSSRRWGNWTSVQLTALFVCEFPCVCAQENWDQGKDAWWVGGVACVWLVACP